MQNYSVSHAGWGRHVWVCEARDLSRDRRVVERGSERVVWIVWEICWTFCEVDIHCRVEGR